MSTIFLIQFGEEHYWIHGFSLKIDQVKFSHASIVMTATAKQANAHELVLSLEKGYDTFIEGNECQLSGGISNVLHWRALYGDPVLLILDEPNSALGSEGTDALNIAVHEFKATGKSVFIMTHRPMAISECDVLLVIENGQLTKLGPRDIVLKSMVKGVQAVNQTIARIYGAGS